MKKTKKKGFTLVELIVVIAIIAILAAVAVPLTMQYTKQAEEKATVSEIGTLKAQLPVILLELQDGGSELTDATFKAALEAKIKPEKVNSIVIAGSDGTDGKIKLTATFTGVKAYKDDTTESDKATVTVLDLGEFATTAFTGTTLSNATSITYTKA